MKSELCLGVLLHTCLWTIWCEATHCKVLIETHLHATQLFTEGTDSHVSAPLASCFWIFWSQRLPGFSLFLFGWKTECTPEVSPPRTFLSFTTRSCGQRLQAWSQDPGRETSFQVIIQHKLHQITWNQKLLGASWRESTIYGSTLQREHRDVSWSKLQTRLACMVQMLKLDLSIPTRRPQQGLSISLYCVKHEFSVSAKGFINIAKCRAVLRAISCLSVNWLGISWSHTIQVWKYYIKNYIYIYVYT